MFYTDFILRIVLSLTLGFLIGLERQLTGHPAGIQYQCVDLHGHKFSLPCFLCSTVRIRYSVSEAVLYLVLVFYAVVLSSRIEGQYAE